MGYLSSSSARSEGHKCYESHRGKEVIEEITVFYKECSIKEANMTPGICKYVKKTVKSLIEEDVKNPFPVLQVQVTSWS